MAPGKILNDPGSIQFQGKDNSLQIDSAIHIHFIDDNFQEKLVTNWAILSIKICRSFWKASFKMSIFCCICIPIKIIFAPQKSHISWGFKKTTLKSSFGFTFPWLFKAGWVEFFLLCKSPGIFSVERFFGIFFLKALKYVCYCNKGEGVPQKSIAFNNICSEQAALKATRSLKKMYFHASSPSHKGASVLITGFYSGLYCKCVTL